MEIQKKILGILFPTIWLGCMGLLNRTNESNLEAPKQEGTFSDFNTSYKEWVGELGKIPTKLHLLKNKKFPETFAGSFYKIGGDSLKRFNGHWEFIQNGDTFVIESMEAEMDFRQNSLFEEEWIVLTESAPFSDAPLTLKGQLLNDSIFAGRVLKNEKIVDSFWFKEVKPFFYPQLFACNHAFFRMEGIIPTFKSEPLILNATSYNELKQLYRKQKLNFYIDPKEIYNYIDTMKPHVEADLYQSVLYQEKNRLALIVYLHYSDDEKHSSYEIQTFNYDLMSRKKVSLEHLFKRDYKNELTKLIRNKLPIGQSFLIDNYIITENGILFILDNQEFTYYSYAFARKLFISFKDLKPIMK